MQAMERELGFSLLDASSHGVTLTNYGKTLNSYSSLTLP